MRSLRVASRFFSSESKQQVPVTTKQTGLDILKSVELHKHGVGNKLYVDGYYDDGFEVSGQRYPGPIALFPKYVFRWHVGAFQQLTPDAFELFLHSKPATEILFIGSGSRTELLHPSIRSHLKQAGIVVEVMASDKALATFNILNEEGRNVAAALLTMTQSKWDLRT